MRGKMNKQTRLASVFLGVLAAMAMSSSGLLYAETDFENLLTEAEGGSTEAQRDVGLAYYDGKGVKKNYDKALFWFQKAANRKDTTAMRYLGRMYGRGQGVAPDIKKAFYWVEQVARAGHPAAQSLLGLLYYEGQGTQKDLKKSFLWSEKAAKQGDPNAQYLLGQHYAFGEGVAKNPEKAAFWWSLAADHDQDYAKNAQKIVKTLTPSQKAELDTSLQTWRQSLQAQK
jgi:TPR repeat protein